MSRATDWLSYAEEDFAAAETLLASSQDSIALYHAHQAAEKGLKALYIERHGENVRTHDLVRLYETLDVPERYRTTLETLNPVDTAARYPDAGSIDVERPGEVVETTGNLLSWIQTRLSE